MLIEFSVANFRSIKDMQVLSFVPTAGREHESSHIFSPGVPGVDRLLRSGVVYGANAAGKSNLLRALDAMADIVVIKNQLGDRLPVTPFLLDDKGKAGGTHFEVVFAQNGIKYQYGFVCNAERVLEEWLYAYPERRAQKWFHRTTNVGGEYEWDFGPSLRGRKKDWSDATRANALFLSTAIQLNAEQLKPVFDWFRSKVRVVVGGGGVDQDYTRDLLEDHSEKIVGLVRNADPGIAAFEVFIKTPSKVFTEIASKALDDEIRERVLNTVSKGVRARHLSTSGKDVWFDLEDESEGTQRLFAWAGPFLDVLENGRLLVIDELNNSLHPVMVKWIIDTFNDPRTNPNNAQLFFATHGTSVLSLEIFRRDQIWFAEKDVDGATSVYSLMEFSPRKEVALEKGYLQGRYGAIPFLSPGLVE